jgi:hypothetical protein
MAAVRPTNGRQTRWLQLPVDQSIWRLHLVHRQTLIEENSSNPTKFAVLGATLAEKKTPSTARILTSVPAFCRCQPSPFINHCSSAPTPH